MAEENGLGGLVKVKVTFGGIAPLLVNRLSEEELLALYNRTRAAKNASRPEPRAAADAKMYVAKGPDGKNWPYMPIKNVMSCLISAGVYVRLDGKKQVSTAGKTTLPAFLTPQNGNDLAWLLDADNKPKLWEVDMQAGKNPNGGEAVCIVRPRIDPPWKFSMVFQIDYREIDAAKVRELFDHGGSRVGLCDFRPTRKGSYGQWKVECWEELKTAPSNGKIDRRDPKNNGGVTPVHF